MWRWLAACAVALVLQGCEEKCPLASLQRRDGATRFWLDQIADQDVDKVPSVVDSKEAWGFRGWAIDAAAKLPARGVYLLIDGVRELRAKYGINRPDVAAASHEPTYALSGFELEVDRAALGVGKHTVSLVIVSADGRGFYHPDKEWAFEVR